MKVTLSPTSFSRSLESDIVIQGGAVLRKVCVIKTVTRMTREEGKQIHTLNSDGGLTWVAGLYH